MKERVWNYVVNTKMLNQNVVHILDFALMTAIGQVGDNTLVLIDNFVFTIIPCVPS